MRHIRSVLSLVAALTVIGFTCGGPGVNAQAAATGASRGLVGVWKVSVSRPTGQGVVLLTFMSDGVFFRSGDTHPVLSVGHGVWKRISDRDFDATYVALRFDDGKKFVGYQKTRLRITVGATENEFTGVAKVSTQDLDNKELQASESKTTGIRIDVEPFE
jgi:hypothetical protein